MKLQCDLCKEIVVADFAIGDGAIEVTCPACHRSFTVAARGRAATPPATAAAPARPAGPMVCPKCGDAQPDATACRSCGLLASKMAEFARRDASVSPEVEAAWADLVAHWSEPAAHDRFHAAAVAGTAFAWAAQRYRDRVRADGSDPIAAEQLARLARTTEITLLATASKKPTTTQESKPFRGSVLLIAVFAAVIAIGLGFAVLTGSPEDPGRAPPPKVRKSGP